MRRLLDTNVLIYAARGRPVHVRERLAAASPDDIALTSVTVAELWFGAEKSRDPAASRAAWSVVLEPYDVLPFDRAAAEEHARIRFALRHQPIGERDLLIAAIALAGGLSVVTNNTSEFGRVPGLDVEDWVGG